MSRRTQRSRADREWRRLQVVAARSPAPWLHGLRRARAQHLVGDPLGQGLVALAAAVGGVGWGAAMLAAGHRGEALLAVALGGVAAVAFVGLTARAVTRGKAIEFWRDRRSLRRALDRDEAYRRLLLATFSEVRKIERHPMNEFRTDQALSRLVRGTYAVLAPAHEDLAVVLAHQMDGRCRIIHSALSPGGRWTALKAGKDCYLDGSFTERLESLAPHHYARRISTLSGPLWIAVLLESELAAIEEELLDPLPACFELVAGRWKPVDAVQVRRLRAVS